MRPRTAVLLVCGALLTGPAAEGKRVRQARRPQRAGGQRGVKEPSLGPAVYPAVLSEQECDALLAEGAALPVGEGFVGGQQGKADPRLRRSVVRALPRERFESVYARITARVEQANAERYHFVKLRLQAIQLGEYSEEQQGFYHWHVDQSVSAADLDRDGRLLPAAVGRGWRVLSATLQLSSPGNYTGGELLVGDGPSRRPSAARGTLVVFPSYALHTVRPVRSGVRYSLVIWLDGSDPLAGQHAVREQGANAAAISRAHEAGEVEAGQLAQVWQLLARTQAAVGKQTEALRSCSESVAQVAGASPDEATVERLVFCHALLAKTAYEQGSLAEAVELQRGAAAASFGVPAARLWQDGRAWRDSDSQQRETARTLATMLSKAGRLEEAVPLYRHGMQADPQHLGSASGLGTALARLGRMPEAESVLAVAVDLAQAQGEVQGLADIVSKHALCLAKLRRMTEAVGAYERALAVPEISAAAREAWEQQRDAARAALRQKTDDATTPEGPMSLQQLASDWLPSPAAGPRDFPELSNYWGSVGVARDAVGLARNAMPPFAATASDFPGDVPWLLVDGRAPEVTHTRWMAYEANRRSTLNISGGTVTVQSAVRMQFEGRHTMSCVTISGRDGQTVNVSLGLRGLVRRLSQGFGWSVPFPTQADAADFSSSLPFYTTIDNASDGLSMFSFVGPRQPAGRLASSDEPLQFRAEFGNVQLPFTFGFTWLVGNDTSAMRRDATLLSTSEGFERAWNESQSGWEERWADAFTPKVGARMGHHSGSLPILASSDQRVRRVYYMAALTLLSVERTNSQQHPRVYFTGGQGTAQFFWDMAQHSYMQTLLDPTAMKAQIVAALRTDWRLYYGVDTDSGEAIGNLYSFDAHAIFTQLDAYLRLTRDTEFLLSNLTGVPRMYLSDPWLNPEFTPAPGRSSVACDMNGLWKPPGLERPLRFTVSPGSSDGSVGYRAEALSPQMDGWSSLNASVTTTGQVALSFWTGKSPGQGVSRGRHVGSFSAECSRMLLDNGEWDKVVLETVPIRELLLRLATDWRQRVRPASPNDDSSWLRVSWADDIAAFLECVPNYSGAVPALYAASAWMMRSVAALSDALRDPDRSLAAALRDNATALESSLFERLYVEGAGYFATVAGADTTNPASPLLPSWDRIDVRTVVDFDYVSHALIRRPAETGGHLTPAIRAEMLGFAKRELITSDWQWLHALSPRDGAASSPLVQRADHGTTGSYDAWVALASEALADLSGNFADMLRLLRGAESATREGCFGNNHLISDSGRPIKTLNNGVYIANNGVSFGDVIVRTLFGFDPQWLAADIPHAELYLRDVPRGGFSGTLSGVRFLGEHVDVAAGAAGVSMRPSPERGG